MNIWFKRLHDQAQLPTKARRGDAAFDLYATDHITLPPGKVTLIPLGLASEFPAGYVAVIKDRSSVASKGLHTCGGVIDSGYRGEWKVAIHNSTLLHHQFARGDRIAQFLFLPVPEVDVVEVQVLNSSDRGEGAFGSTGL